MPTGFMGKGGTQNVPPGQGPILSPQGLKDYQHASKLFLSNGYGLVPRYKFLFYVYFNINVSALPAQLKSLYNQNSSIPGQMVKEIELPKFKINTTTLNQYNRKRLVQSKINYEPSRIVLHDDQSDLVRGMWYNYFSYYYKDSSNQYGSTPNTNGTNGPDGISSNGFNYNDDVYNLSLIHI